ncbi:protein kinase [Nocardiopsis sp. EMB25]|uniref:serine/threonine-protein kinase n=1 Tax=Nocardiopsis sp. EMB25 TaxID=2835867 RepID=UPI002283AA0D|nr:serine/threonine-protein kinase [Nocardiopsis sp. EMB25]MCY9785852.1 protein kinase [Nocardiopsis sp. EMB25]
MPSDGLPKNLEPLAAGDPATIGPYVLSGKLGSGGMGTVYLGSTAERNNQVAIKVIRPELAFDEATRARFRDEMENARKVASFCTAKVLDHGTFENRPYMVTEYIAGTALAEHIAENGPLDSSTLHGFALGVAAALAAIHRTGLVHRDLKPANVLLSLSGPRVIDFGIARAMNTATNHTQTGIVMGSPGWMAPEQLLEEQVTTSADIFAWGCLVAFAGNGTHPFGNGDAMTLGKRVLFAEPQIGNLDSPLDRLVLRALAKEPGRRPTAQDLLLELAGGEDNSNPNDMVSHALHQSWRPNLPPMPPGGPQPGMHPAQQTMTGMRPPPPPPGRYQAGPVPPPAHQTGTFPRPQAPPPAARPAGARPSGPPPGNQNAPRRPAPAQPHPASTGPIPMAPSAEQQGARPGPQPYVPPVPPPPHRPAAPNRRKGIVLGLAAAVAAVLIAVAVLLAVLSTVNGSAPWADADADGDSGQEQSGAQRPAPEDEDKSEDAEDREETSEDAVPGDAPVRSADGMVEYEIEDVDCNRTRDEYFPRSEIEGGQYCFVGLRMTNLGDEQLRFLSDQQYLLVEGGVSPYPAESPTPLEGDTDGLWAQGGIPPRATVGGELAFIIEEGERPTTVQLTHRSGLDRTQISIEHLVD